jgi:hypothetical protein
MTTNYRFDGWRTEKMMQTKSIKPLWSIEGDRQSNGVRIVNTLYGFSGNPHNAYNDQISEPAECILGITRLDGTEVGFVFDNDEIDGVRFSELLRQYILNEGGMKQMFTFEDRKTLVVVRDKAQTDLLDLLYSWKHSTTVEAAIADNARLRDREACYTFYGKAVYNLRWANVESDTLLSPKISKGDVEGVILRGKRTMCILLPKEEAHEEAGEYSVEPYYFSTDYDNGFYRLCAQMSNAGAWSISKEGALKITFSKGQESPVTVSFAEIVGTYFRQEIDMDRPVESICDNHAAFRTADNQNEKIVYDHLTHNEECDLPWALAPVTDMVNKQTQGRDKIKPPFYFFTVYDQAINKYKVKLGVYGLGWERRYLFDDLTYKNPDEDEVDIFTPRFDYGSKKDNTLYVAIYERFKEKIGKENTRAETSYLSYWAKPERAYCDGNMLTAMLDEPEDTYTPALEGFTADSWDDMPIV